MEINISRLNATSLKRHHAHLEKQLQRLVRRKHPTPVEQLEMRQIKRMKLAVKDRITTLVPADVA